MQDGKQVINQVTQQLQVSSPSIPTEAGQTGSNPQTPSLTPAEADAAKSAIIDALNQMFAEFELVYHNQFNKAFPTPEKLLYAKRLWFNNLKEYRPAQIIDAAHRAVRESEYLPTIRGILKYLDTGMESHGLPSAHSAYIEACRAPSPKADYKWSHPAVYYAGRASDWFFLASNTEFAAFKIFERNYQLLCDRVMKGEELDVPVPVALPEKIHQPLSKEEQKAHMKQLREQLKI
jgi:hypothetical protein